MKTTTTIFLFILVIATILFGCKNYNHNIKISPSIPSNIVEDSLPESETITEVENTPNIEPLCENDSETIVLKFYIQNLYGIDPYDDITKWDYRTEQITYVNLLDDTMNYMKLHNGIDVINIWYY